MYALRAVYVLKHTRTSPLFTLPLLASWMRRREVKGRVGQQLAVACQENTKPILDMFRQLIVDLSHSFSISSTDEAKIKFIQDFTTEKVDIPQALGTLTSLPKHEVCLNPNHV